MGHARLWKSVAKYVTLCQNLSNFPLMFTDNKDDRVTFITGFRRLKFFWMSMLLFSFSNFCGIVVIGGRWQHLGLFDDMALWKILIAAGFTALGLFIVAINLAFYAYCATLSEVFDHCLQLERQLNRLLNRRSSKKQNVFPLLLECIAYLGIFVPLFGSAFVILIQADPVGALCHGLFPEIFNNTKLSRALLLFRYCTCYISTRETYRGLWMVIFWAETMGQWLLQFAEHIGQLKNPQMFFELYIKYILIYTFLSPIAEIALLGGMSAAFIIGISGNFAALKLYYHVSFVLYVNMVIIAIVIPALMNFTIPLIIRTHETTCDVLKDKYLKYSYFRRRNPSLMKQVKSLRPLTPCAGISNYRLYRMDKSTMTVYGRAYIDYTINALMNVHV